MLAIPWAALQFLLERIANLCYLPLPSNRSPFIVIVVIEDAYHGSQLKEYKILAAKFINSRLFFAFRNFGGVNTHHDVITTVSESINEAENLYNNHYLFIQVSTWSCHGVNHLFYNRRRFVNKAIFLLFHALNAHLALLHDRLRDGTKLLPRAL